jgi:hypothetical protein
MEKKSFFDYSVARYKKTLWFVAILITLSSAVYQRLTGPTHPVRGEILLSGSSVSYKLLRSSTVDKNATIKIFAPDSSITGYIRYKRYKSYDEWTISDLVRDRDQLIAQLPKQPPAGKMIYSILIQKGQETISLTKDKQVVLRYKGGVPLWVLLPHVFFMFFAMLYSNRTGLEALDSKGNAKRYMYWSIALFFIGGLILGPIVQKYAFGSFWEGIPFGYDLTDNKTLIAMLGWIIAWIMNRKQNDKRGWMILASVLMLAVYLIPHSVLGSEIDYTQSQP